MFINLVLYYYHVHWSSTVLLARRWVKYCIFALYVKSLRRLSRSGWEARPPPLLSSSRRLQQRQGRRRRRCRGIFLAAAAASVSSVASGIAPLSSASSSPVMVDEFLPPPSSSAAPQREDPQRVSTVPFPPSEDLVSPCLWRRIRHCCRKREGFVSLLPSFFRRSRSRRRCRCRNGEIG